MIRLLRRIAKHRSGIRQDSQSTCFTLPTGHLGRCFPLISPTRHFLCLEEITRLQGNLNDFFKRITPRFNEAVILNRLSAYKISSVSVCNVIHFIQEPQYCTIISRTFSRLLTSYTYVPVVSYYHAHVVLLSFVTYNVLRVKNRV